MRGRKRLAIVLAVALLAVVVSMIGVTAGAEVQRYQFQTVSVTLDYYSSLWPNGNPYTQTFTVTINPCTGEFSGAGLVPPPWGVTTTVGTINGNQISYTTEYAIGPGPQPYTITAEGTLTSGLSFTGTWSDTINDHGTVAAAAVVTWTSNYNHGEYVAEFIDEYGDAPHSCIGMPIVSNGKTG